MSEKIDEITFIVAVNDEQVFENNLYASEILRDNKINNIIKQYNYSSASLAYNEAIKKIENEILIFVHQDVYFPNTWRRELVNALQLLDREDPRWAVAGVYGVTASGQGVGHVYSSGLRCFVGEAFKEPVRVSTLDEMVLIIRKSSGLNFDEGLPGFHLYGADICLEAERRGMTSYVIPCFTVHNSCGINWLPIIFWKAYMYLRRKWRSRLPIFTPCTIISFSCSAIFDHVLRNIYLRVRGGNTPGCRVKDPEIFYRERIMPVLAER